MTGIAVFLIFGLVMNPARLLPSVPEGLRVGLAMMLVARPQGVMVFPAAFVVRAARRRAAGPELHRVHGRGAEPAGSGCDVAFVCRRLGLTAAKGPVPLPS
jgi:hypothetical protein